MLGGGALGGRWVSVYSLTEGICCRKGYDGVKLRGLNLPAGVGQR